MAQVQNMVIECGSTYENDLTVTDANGAVMDITAYSARCAFRKSPSSSAGFVIPTAVAYPGAAGIVKLTMTPAQTRAIKPGRYLYVVEIYTASDADVLRIVEGLVTFSASTYRPA